MGRVALGMQLYVGRRAPTPRSRRFRGFRRRALLERGPCLGSKPAHGLGLWTAPYEEGVGSPWTAWCECEEYAPLYAVVGHRRILLGQWRGYVLRPRAAARIVVVDNYADLERLVARYPAPPIRLAPRGVYAELPGLDFAVLARDYDGLYVTEDGEQATRFTVPTLYGWDCQSVVWFRWCFEGNAEPVTFPVQRAVAA
jgi:hypothetical protein